MFGLGMQELIIVGIVAVLLFGRKLPDVARSLGTSYREFKGGLSDLKSQVNVNEVYDDTYNSSSSSYDDFDDRDEATAPRFEPPPSDDQDDASESGVSSTQSQVAERAEPSSDDGADKV